MNEPTDIMTPDAETQELAARAQELRAGVDALIIQGPVELARADDALVAMALRRKELEAKRKFFTAPLNEHVKAINVWFKRLTDPLEEADKALRLKVVEYRRAEQERVNEEKRKAAQEAAKAAQAAQEAERAADRAAQGGLAKSAEAIRARAQEGIAKANQGLIQASVASAHAPQATRAASGGNVITRKVWKWEILNDVDVPRQYLGIDRVAITEAVRQGIRTIPGVRIFEDDEILIKRTR